MTFKALFFFLFFCFSFYPFADDTMILLPDSHAPISVMGDHVHKKGEWMLSYRYMQMQMNSMLNGSQALSYDQHNVSTSYMRYLDDMTMNMHMFGFMWAMSDKFTFMAMMPYVSSDMSAIARMGGAVSSMSSEGISDFKIGGLFSILDSHSLKAHLNAVFSLPTGAVDVEDNGMVLGYPMQLGSGTFDFLPSLTVVRFFDTFSFGNQLSLKLHTGTNSKGYRLGDSLKHVFWFSKRIQNVSLSTSLVYFRTLAIEGEHRDIAMAMNAAQDVLNTGKEELNLGLGVNYIYTKGTRFAIEYLLPVIQNVNGYQMNQVGTVTFGIQKAY